MFNLRLMTNLWGEEAITNFKQGALKSLLWPKNKAALQGATWDMWTFEPYVEELERLIFNNFDVKFEPHIITDNVGYLNQRAPGLIPYLLHTPFRLEMEACLNTTSKLLLLPPDTVFSDGAIANILKIGADPTTVVCVPHVRVYEHIRNYLNETPLAAPSLCKLAWETLHPSWITAEKGHPETSSFWSGCVWEKLEDNLYSVSHRIPTPYLISFTGQDHAAWQHYNAFSAIDHMLPSDTWVKNGRIRMPGSSDAAMICEITGPGNNIPPKTPPEVIQQGNPADYYWRDTLHAAHNRQFQTIFRSE